MTRRKRRFFSLVLLTAIVVVAKGALRLFTPAEQDEMVDNLTFNMQLMRGEYELLPGSPLFWRPQPVRLMGGHYIVQQDGFRGFSVDDKLPDTPAPPGVMRVVCLGDSVTFGWIIQFSEQTWPAQLQNFLGAKYQVLNLARPGYSRSQRDSR